MITRPWHRKRRVLGALIVLCVFAMAFLYDGVRWGDKPETRADVVGRDVVCERGVHLGLIHECTVAVQYEGKTHTTWFRHELGPEDVGREVAITVTGKSPRTGLPWFTVARAYDGPPRFLLVLAWLMLGITAFVLLFRIFAVTRSLNRTTQGFPAAMARQACRRGDRGGAAETPAAAPEPTPIGGRGADQSARTPTCRVPLGSPAV